MANELTQTGKQELTPWPKHTERFAEVMCERWKQAGWRKYTAVTDKMVAWCEANIGALEAITTRPDPKNAANRAIARAAVAQGLALYAPVRSYANDSEYRGAVAVYTAIIDAMTDDVCEYQPWAIKEGFRAHRAGQKGQYMPKSSGEILPGINAAIGKAEAAHTGAVRVLSSNKAGYNMDQMRRDRPASGKAAIDHAIRCQGLLEDTGLCYTDPDVKALWDEFQAIRLEAAKSLNITPEPERRNEPAGNHPEAGLVGADGAGAISNYLPEALLREAEANS